MLPRWITLTSYTAKRVARRLRVRVARQRLIDEKEVQHWECATQWDAILVLLLAAGWVYFFVSEAIQRAGPSAFDTEIFANLPHWAKLQYIGVCTFLVLWGFGIPAFLITQCRHAIWRVFSRRQIVSASTDRLGIEVTDQQGGQRYYVWRDLKRIGGLGRLDFGGASPGTVVLSPKDHGAWEILAILLFLKFLPNRVATTSKTRGVQCRCVLYYLVGMLVSYLAISAPPLANPMGAVTGFWGITAFIVALVVIGIDPRFNKWFQRRFDGKRPRTFGFAKF